MKTETPYTFYEYKVSPNYNEIKNFSIPTSFDRVNDMARSSGSFDPNFRYV